MKVTVDVAYPEVAPRDLKVGDVIIKTDPYNNGRDLIFIVAFDDRIVCLEDPSVTYSNISKWGTEPKQTKFYKLPKGTKITLEV